MTRLIIMLVLMFATPAAFAACSVNADSFVWSNVGLLTRPYDTVGTVRIQCDASTPYTLKAGNPGQSTWRLSQGTAWIEYRIYSDPARSLLVPINGTIKSGVGSGSSDSIPIYARIPAGTPKSGVVAGTYTSTVPLIVEY